MKLKKAIEIIKDNRIDRIDLDNNQIGDDGAQALATALEHNTTLNILSLWNNKIGSTGAQALAQALAQNDTLSLLYLDNHLFEDDRITGVK
jgi:Ran GTPase-activating protein (RanGAP) involved in mRNA processing and transport